MLLLLIKCTVSTQEDKTFKKVLGKLKWNNKIQINKYRKKVIFKKFRESYLKTDLIYYVEGC